ncbi:MAG: PAS domain-containing sensor histidine kinase [Winogradskyella sp.]|uniref:PAS domain-containing sensor histidine kinase n=1 Tax=Winogradskyella sp. TaxID=1883156 RepID=UPI0025E10925|nr:PAS domain-containing sensor histidine kinase [Winogradskyella sp.]NRB60469.1 PAS domain-containing sensor histidine kinase [Winogradskyella sp.]
MEAITEIWQSNQQDQVVAALNTCAMVSITDTAGNIIFVNDKFCEISGYEEEELIGKNHRMFKSGLHPDSIYENLWKTISSGKVWTGEICNKTKSGGLVWFTATIVPFKDEFGIIEKYVAIRSNISELKAKEEELEYSKLSFKQLFNLAPDAYLVCNNEGLILNCNQATEELTGYSQKELLFKNIFDINLITKRSKVLFKKSLESSSAGQDKTELQIVSKSGKKVTLEVASHKIDLNNRKVVLSIGRDITQRNKILQELNVKTLDLEVFIYRASHEMKAPFTTIEGLLNLLKEEKSSVGTDAIIKMMEFTLKNGKSMLDNLNSVRTILKGDLEREVVDLKNLVTQIIYDLSYMDNYEEVNFEVDIPTNFKLFGNSFLLKSVFLNLIQNSIKYNIPKTDGKSPNVKITAFKVGNTAVAHVIDNGLGIKPDEQDKVFDLYYRSNYRKEGCGLGLYITKNAVERLGGQIDLTSFQNQFTKFEIKIPLVSQS